MLAAAMLCGVLGGPGPSTAWAQAQARDPTQAPSDPEDLPPPDVPADAPPETLSLGEQCLAEGDRQERALNIPTGLLRAIMLAESGRWDATAKTLRAWPWTLNIGGTGSYHDTRDQARAVAAEALRGGIRQVDLGCMQVSLAWHADAFRTLTEALEPASNVAYGARYLRALYDQHKDWSEAVRRYHSGEAGRGNDYLRRVVRLWQGTGPSGDGTGTYRVVTAAQQDSPHHKAAQALASGDAARARKLYAAILKRNPDDRTALAGTAMAYERLSETVQAIEAWGAYLAREPGSERAARRLVQLTVPLAPPEADLILSDMVRTAPDNPFLLDALARRRLESGDAETAAALFARAAALAPEDPALAYNAAVTLDRLGRPQAAMRAYEALLTHHGRNPAAQATLPLEAARQRLVWLRGQGARP